MRIFSILKGLRPSLEFYDGDVLLSGNVCFAIRREPLERAERPSYGFPVHLVDNLVVEIYGGACSIPVASFVFQHAAENRTKFASLVQQCVDDFGTKGEGRKYLRHWLTQNGIQYGKQSHKKESIRVWKF